MILVVFILLLLAIAVFLYKAFAIISGYGTKTMCSNIFLCGRKAEEVLDDELGTFPLNLGNYMIDVNNKTVTGSVAGLAKKTAIYERGTGAALIRRRVVLRVPTGLQSNLTSKLDQDLVDWPMGNRRAFASTPSLNPSKLEAAVELAFDASARPRRGTRAVIVLHQGKIVAERYANGFTANSKLAGWSMAKSVTSALAGILIGQDKLALHEPVGFSEWKNDRRKNITPAHLLQMSSGLRWWEYYAAPSDATHMLYNEQNMGLYALNKRLKYEPGSRFSYSSGSTNILSYLIRQRIGDDNEYYRFPYESLFHKTGMLQTVLETDGSGTFVGSSYCFATARDWARFGLLYLDDGMFNGQRILPEGWVQFTATPTTAAITTHDGGYGAQWWLNTPGRNGKRKYAAVPEDCFACQGYEGQYIWVIPSEKLVVVRLALEKGDVLDPNVFLTAIIEAMDR